MKLNRKNMTAGIAALGLLGVLAGGAGVAVAATGSAGAPTPAPSAGACPYGGMPGMGLGTHAMAKGENAPFTAAAAYLGLSQSDLRTQLQDGKSLADVAKAQSKSVSGLKDAMVAAMKKNLDANTTLTADQKNAMLDRMKSHLDTMVDTAHPAGAGMGPRGGRMHGMMR